MKLRKRYKPIRPVFCHAGTCEKKLSPFFFLFINPKITNFTG